MVVVEIFGGKVLDYSLTYSTISKQIEWWKILNHHLRNVFYELYEMTKLHTMYVFASQFEWLCFEVDAKMAKEIKDVKQGVVLVDLPLTKVDWIRTLML